MPSPRRSASGSEARNCWSGRENTFAEAMTMDRWQMGHCSLDRRPSAICADSCTALLLPPVRSSRFRPAVQADRPRQPRHHLRAVPRLLPVRQRRLAQARVDPGDLPAWGAFNELQERNFDALHARARRSRGGRPDHKDADLRKLGTFYSTCMDSARAETAGVKPLAADLARIAAVRSRSDLAGSHRPPPPHRRARGLRLPLHPGRQEQLPRHRRGVPGRPRPAGPRLLHPGRFRLAGAAREATRRTWRSCSRWPGGARPPAPTAARGVLAIETALARASMTPVEQRDPEAIYHLTTLADLQAAAAPARLERLFPARSG